MAVIQACEDIIAQCKERAARTWDCDVDQVDWQDGQAVPKPGQNIKAEPISLAISLELPVELVVHCLAELA